MRKTLKIFHTLAAAGMIGGLGCYILLLVFAPQDTPANYADMRQSINIISDYILIPTLGVAIVTGLVAMIVQPQFQNMRWVWFKAALGLLMFKGMLTLVGSMANHAATYSRRLAEGEPVQQVLDEAIIYEWEMLWTIMAISVANVVLGVWRPKMTGSRQRRAQAAPDRS